MTTTYYHYYYQKMRENPNKYSVLQCKDIIRAERRARGGRFHLISPRYSRATQLQLLAGFRASGQLLLCSTAIQVTSVCVCVAKPLHA